MTLSWYVLAVPLLCPCFSLASLPFTYLGDKGLHSSLLISPQGMRDPTHDLGADPPIFWPHQHHRRDLISLSSISVLPLPPPPLSFLPPPLPSSTPPPALGSAFPLFPSGNDSRFCLPPAPPASQTFIGRGRARADFSLQRPRGCGRQWAFAPVGSMFFPAALPAQAFLEDVWLSLGPWREFDFFS